MKLNPNPRQNVDPLTADWRREVAKQVNTLSEGRLAATYNASAAAPTTGTYALGDFIRNNAPAELGAIGSKYLIFGWVCSVAGTPGTWLQCRFLTGN